MKCKLCDKGAMVGYDYCKKHFIEIKKEEFLDNSNPDDPGVLKWARYFLPDYVPYESPKFHKVIIREFFRLYDPAFTNRFQRQLNIKAYRGASKSTLINMIINTYIVANNKQTIKILGADDTVKEVTLDERLIVIASETGSSAEDFVVRIRNELKANKRIRYFYKEEVQEVIDDDTGQWTKRAFKFNNCYVLGIGGEQQIRGKIKEASRPTLVTLDDIYSENNVLTEKSRKKVKYWFDEAIYNTIDNQRGKIVFIGTVVHEDTIIVENERSGTWRNIEIPIMNLQQFERIVREHLKVDYENAKVELPYDNIENDVVRYSMQKKYFQELQEKEKLDIAWKEKDDLYIIMLLFKNAVIKRNLSAIYQEYFHQIVPEEDMRIKPHYIQEVEVEFKKEGRNTFIKTSKHNEYMTANIEIGLDFGTGTNDGDDDAIVAAAALHNGEYVILKEVSGKFGERDTREYTGDFGRVEFNREKITKRGAMDEAIRLAVEYGATAIKIGYSGTEKSRIYVLRQLLNSNRIFTVNVYGRKQQGFGDKAERIFNNIALYYQSRRIYHNKGLEKLTYQIKFLGASEHDDVADALECALYNIRIPSQIITTNLPRNIGYPTKNLFKKETPAVRRDWRV